MNKIIIRITAILLILFAATGFVTAQTVISADIENDLYRVGDTVYVRIHVQNNTQGFRSLYFDLEYDGSVLAFDRLEKGNMFYNIDLDHEFLYASNDGIPGSMEKNLIVSYVLEQAGAMTHETGTFIELIFKVIDNGVRNGRYGFTFNENRILDNPGNELAGTVWENSKEFMIDNSVDTAFILIRYPGSNQVFYNDSVGVNAISTADPDYHIIVSNENGGFVSSPLSALSGSIEDVEVPLVYGYNIIKTVLVSEYDDEIASDTVTVLRKDDDTYVKIISPKDHALVNRDMVRVVISSQFTDVTINGTSIGVKQLDEKDGNNILFEKNIWLYKGFNTISVTAEGDDGEMYEDEIVVYYQKNDSVFRFVTPSAGEMMKTNQSRLLTIKGEISSQYKQEGILNTVTLNAVYVPYDSVASAITLIDNEPAEIMETDIDTGYMQAPYMFVHTTPVDITGLEAGEIILTAYKNKTGTLYENMITRIAYVKKNQLDIHLIQPNIYGEDVFNNLGQFEGFNGGTLPDFNDLELLDDGSIVLSENRKVINEIRQFSGSQLVDVAELKDGSVIAMLNESNILKIYKKEFGKNTWNKIFENNDMYGYDLCETDLGVLIGVSNLFTNENSGLYLLKEDGCLVNIVIGEPISHVQFVKNMDGTIYLYGNNYSHLYSFNIYSMEESDGTLIPAMVSKDAFDNDYFINQFELNTDRNIAVIRTIDDSIHFYRKTGDGSYKEIIFADTVFNREKKFSNIICGEYETGSYSSYLLTGYNGSFTVVMEEKNTHRLIINNLENNEVVAGPDEEVLGLGFRENHYVFIVKDSMSHTYKVKRAQILFNKVYWDNNFELNYNGADIPVTNKKLLITRFDSYYLGWGREINENESSLFELTREFVTTSTMEFDYINQDIEGIKGFSFEVESFWFKTENIEIGFSLKEDGNSIEELSHTKISLQELIEDHLIQTTIGTQQNVENHLESKLYKLFYYYDEIRNKYIISVDFNTLQTNERYPGFDITLHSPGNTTPSVSNITIYKKIPVKIPKSSDEYTYLPVHGRINDVTVKQVKIKDYTINVERDGSFSYLYPILSSEVEVPFTVSCKNEAGETVDISFLVILIDSKNRLWEIDFVPVIGKPATADENEIHTDEQIINVSGYYFGLKGASAGYVLYKYDIDYEENTENSIIIDQGVFTGSEDSPLEVYDYIPADWPVPDDFEDPGSGFEYGMFQNQKIKLLPGKQVLVLYIENPGGFKTEYKIEEKYPLVVYNLPEDEQEILITNPGLEELEQSDQYEINEITVNKRINITVPENADYEFKKNYTIQGEIKSLYKIYTVLVKSFSPDVTFENGLSEIVVDVDELERFEVTAYIEMKESSETEDYHFAFIPEPPFLNWMKTGLCLGAEKSFVNAAIKPDFSLMDEWTDEEKENLEKQVYLKFNRFIPESTMIKLLVNFETAISGELICVHPEDGMYKLVENAQNQFLSGVKYGQNRVQWWLSYDKGLISSSVAGDNGMEDYVFELICDEPYQATLLTFPVDLQTYYGNPENPLPGLSIQKDRSTSLVLKLNNKNIWEDNTGKEHYSITDWSFQEIIEGKNVVDMSYKEFNNMEKSIHIDFLYDTLPPEILIDSYKYDDEYKYLLEITAIINEAHLDKTYLISVDDSEYGSSRIDSDKIVEYTGNNIYKVKWYNLKNFFILPSETFPVRIEAEDHSGKTHFSEDFTGINDLIRPGVSEAEILDISDYLYIPEFTGKPYYAHDDGNDPYNGHMKFYNSSIGLTNIDVEDSEIFRIERARDIKTDENFSIYENGSTLFHTGNKVVLGPGFSTYSGGSLSVDIVSRETALEFEPYFYEFTHNKESDSISMLFWFRYEYEDYYTSLYNTEEYRRILTLYEDSQNSVYLGFKEGEDYLYLIDRITEGDDIYDIVLINGMLVDMKYNHGNPADWNIINIGIQYLQNRVYVGINNNEPLYVNLPDDYDYIIEDILKDGAGYYFGSKDGHETGHFSVAGPFYINEIVDIDTALVLCNYNDTSEIIDDVPHRLYNFNSITDDIGNNFYQLRVEGDHFSPYENSNYSEDETRGSLKATTHHENYLTITDNGVIFKDADNPVLVNLKIPDLTDNNGGAIRIEPSNSIYPGKYFFGNKLGNHGITTNNWYSVSGYINPVIENGREQPVDAKLILRINNKTESIILKPGDFHLVFEHDINDELNDVVMYIETMGVLSFEKNLIFNQGNFILPPEGLHNINQSRAFAHYIFYPKGTVEFWYKPINTNREGFVNDKAILFDSTYIQIGTRIETADVPGKGCAKYFAKISGILEPDVMLNTDVLVKEEWQHIQLSYSRDDNIAYFYIDGTLAAFMENVTLPMPEEIGNEDNVCLGSRMDGLYYAEGYLDDIHFSSLYKGPVYRNDLESYNDRNPVSFAYTDSPQPELTIGMNGGSKNIDSVLYILDSKDEFFREITKPGLFQNHGFDMPGLQSNSYILRAKMTINGHRYAKKFNFIKNNTPSFTLKDYTPLIINGIESEIRFSLDYDNSYLLSTNESTYAGAAVRITGSDVDENGNEMDFEKTHYIIQDFVHQNPRNRKWYTNTQEGIDNNLEWTELTVRSNRIDVVFDEIKAVDDIAWELKTFYSFEVFDPTTESFDILETEQSGVIANAYFTVEKSYCEFLLDGNEQNQTEENIGRYEYKLNIIAGSGRSSNKIFSDLAIFYRVESLDHEDVETINNTKNFEGTNFVDIYYDDILPINKYGQYKCTLSLQYKDNTYGAREPVILNWEKPEKVLFEEDERRLTIYDFSLLYLDKQEDKAKFYLEYGQNALEDIFYDLYIKSMKTGEKRVVKDHVSISPLNTYEIIDDIELPEGESYINIKIYTSASDMSQGKEIFINNSETAPEVYLTNTVPTLIGYNNVLFTWKGYVNGKYNANIEYAYTLDGNIWSSYGEWEKVEFYNLKEGSYNFAVKARLGTEESTIKYAPFIVDINRPLIDTSKIDVHYKTDDAGILYAIDIIAGQGAVSDFTLLAVEINGESIKFSLTGSFIALDLPIRYDGINEFVITARDRVGRFTDYLISVDNKLTTILFPKSDVKTLYTPMTLVGKLDEDINIPVDIYVFDPLCREKGAGNHLGHLQSDFNMVEDYSTWRKATINADRTFFVEDIYINPGTELLEAHTPLKIAVKLNHDKVFTRDIDVWANELYRPIDINLSTHAVEGEREATKVTIECRANVSNISSWSIDFTGDGIYDEVKMIDNPAKAQKQTWIHSYSSLGIVKPRVRVITLDGNYFSVADEIIIHEKIKEASNVIVNNPISMTSVVLPEKATRIYVLAGVTNDYRIEAYEVGRNETYISNRLFTISLWGFGIDNPVRIRAIDKDTIIVAHNRNGRGYVVLLKANEFNNYLPDAENLVITDNEIRDITIDRDYPGLMQRSKNLFISFTYAANLAVVPFKEGSLVPSELEYVVPEIMYNENTGSYAGLAKDSSGLLVCDYYNQRIVRLSGNFKAIDYFGEFGSGEKEFIKPSRITSFENRIFIYDESRRDIQILDPNYQTQVALSFDPGDDDNYFEPGFLDDIRDMGVILKEENGMLYYYTLLLSAANNKLSMLRLPQAEELRARVRNNKIVFLKDREVMTAKPVGSDLTKILSSDSIPRIEGNLDYPALSPDGKQLVFTSRIELYNGDENGSNEGSNIYAYDNLYVYDVETRELIRIPLADIQYYEIERPQFNSNGDKLIFSAKPTGSNWQIYQYNFKTGGIGRLFTTDENARFPYYSPEDRFVVFTTDYDGDEEIEIIDTQNINVRVSVTHNEARDSFPVWIYNYPFEISNEDLNIKSKIAFVSERNYNKSLYYTYIRRQSEGDIRIVTKSGEETGDDPDSAAIRLTPENTEGDYPCFTGNGKKVVYEYYDGYDQVLREYDFETEETEIKDLPKGSTRPAGMKNTIADFKAVVTTGNDIKLDWRSYTDKEIFYTVRFRINQEGKPFVQKKVFTKDSALLTDLIMGVEYLVKVCIIENNEEVALTRWEKVGLPEVAAIPGYEIDKDNPYLIKLKGWKPEPHDDHDWKYSWIIDNQEIASAQLSQDYAYEFATSGTKTIQLKVSNKENTATSISEPFTVKIKTDIEPIVEHTIINSDKTYIELDASQSRGNKIDLASAAWVISGPGSLPIGPYTGSKIILGLEGFTHKINVNLKVRRKTVAGQQDTDVIEKNYVYDLDLEEVKPVITYNADNNNPRLFIFSGENSLGNIDWYRARWLVYADGIELHREDGVSSFAFPFPEMGNETSYSVTLTVPRRNDGQTKTTSVIVSVDPCPIEPVIDYEILTLKDGYETIGAKLLLSCSGSKGSSIDFNSARWSVPVAGSYNEQPTQGGPTAIYNLFTTEEIGLIDVSLILMRRGGTDTKTITELIRITPGELSEIDMRINKEMQKSTTGTQVTLDILPSRGVNIEWEKTTWHITTGDSPVTITGPVAQVNIPSSAETTIINYVCSVYRYGITEPVVKRGAVMLDNSMIRPVISYELIPGKTENLYSLSILDTPGVNIDWERTTWYIYDGNETVTNKYGAKIVHAFALKSEAFGYPVMVEMFFKGNTKPFTGYTSIDVAGDELVPLITWDRDYKSGDDNVFTFTAQDSSGSNIDWSQAKWTFGDSSEFQYGPVVVHKFPVDDTKKEYRVSLTLTRKSANNQIETKTVYKTVNIAGDTLKPVIKGQIGKNGYLILSAGDSEGRGLLLDRSLWIFEGKGDNESLNVNEKIGEIISTSDATSTNNTIQVVPSISAWANNAGASFGGVGYIRSWGDSSNTNITEYDGFKDMTTAYSSSNIHTGALCRKYVREFDTSEGSWNRESKRSIMVTLFVYRIGPDGGMTGKSITVNIDLEKASDPGGVRYE